MAASVRCADKIDEDGCGDELDAPHQVRLSVGHASVARRNEVADGLATALLAGPWTAAAMHARCLEALDRTRPPRWLDPLVQQVLAVYHQAPADAPRELAAYLQGCVAWDTAWRQRRPPRVVTWTPVPTRMNRPAWPVTDLPDLAALCLLLDIDHCELAWFADVRGLESGVVAPLRHYRWTALPKRSGVRLVAAPKPRLKEIQRRLLRHVFAPIPVHEAAHGCVPGRSVRSAVQSHAGAAVLIRADLTSFFGSIAAGRVWELLRVAGYPEAVAHSITGLVTTVVPVSLVRAMRGDIDARVRRGLAVPHLPQGAPTSPAVANSVAFTLDRRLAGLAARFGARYTRYVDDLLFSGSPSLRRSRGRFLERVDEIARSEGFRLNAAKTAAMGNARRQAALGAVVNTRPTVPRQERDALRAILHNCAVHGWRGQQRGEPDLRAHLLGRISWVNGLDPEFGTKLRTAFDAIDWS
jgi:hypothetical protein